MSEVNLVIDDCAAVTGTDVRAIRTRNSAQGRKNWTFKFDGIVTGLPDRLTDRQMDWLEIHGAIFAGDLAVPREPGLGWNRSIVVHVPVRDPNFWQPFAAQFEDIFASLTQDRLSLQFHSAEEFAEAPRPRKKPFAASDSIALLSGGMDSFVGALELLVTHKRTPLFLAASGSGATHHAQGSVEKIIKGIDGDREMLRLTAKRAAQFPGDEKTQRSRSFLYTSSAALVAAAIDSETVYVNENGVMAIHAPMNAARIGSLSTRTASPRVLDQIGELATSVFEKPIRIENLLVGFTKPEVAQLADQLGYAGSLKETVSCWAISHKSKHCGTCAPCLTRRISCSTHGIDDVDYELDVFNDPAALVRTDAKDALVHMIDLVERFSSADLSDLELDFPELLGGGNALSMSDTFAMYKRWSDQAIAVLSGAPEPSKLMAL